MLVFEMEIKAYKIYVQRGILYSLSFAFVLKFKLHGLFAFLINQTLAPGVWGFLLYRELRWISNAF